MIMTAELNSHQRVSWFTGVKLIRHHQSASTANSGNNSTANASNSSNTATSSAATGGFYHQHPNHYPPHPPPHHPHHPHHHHQQHPPPLPPHHPGHFHLPCPTGPPHIQHPGGVLHLGNHHGPPHHSHGHHNHNGHHHYGGGGSNQTTRLYTGSPLIRSTGYHSLSGGSGGGLGSHKRSFKNNQHKNNLSSQHHHGHHPNIRSVGIGNPNLHHHHHQNIIGSCSSGSNSSSSSNEHLNNLQSPSGSPLTQAKLDISPLKLSSSPTLNGELSSSNNSSPGPQGSPSPSTSSNLSTSSSPNSTDANKDLDHFYFLDEHWKPSNDGIGGIGINPVDIMDVSGSSNGTRWNSSSSGSPSPPTVNTAATALTMMVDQFFANGHNNNNNFGLVDDNNNFIGLNNGLGIGGGQLRDSNNNIIGEQHPNLNETQPRNDRFHDSFSSGFNSGNNLSSGNEGASGLFHFGATGAKFNSSPATTSTTVVNVETQIGTFNGQRDLEIRLCFIKGDHHSKTHSGPIFGESGTSQFGGIHTNSRMNADDEDSKAVTAIGDPFKTVASVQQEQAEMQSTASSSSNNEMPDNKGGLQSVSAIGNIGMPMANNKDITQQS